MKKTTHIYPYEEKKEDPRDIVKWCRRNFGDRAAGWDFYLTKKDVIIEIWKEEYEVMYVLWKK